MVPNVVLRMDDYWRETESLGKYSNISARIWIHKYSPLQKLCVTPLWRRNREDNNIELALVEFLKKLHTVILEFFNIKE